MAYGTLNADKIGTSNQNISLGAGDSTLMKNRIINGAMYVAQRSNSATITAGSTIAAGYATVDRFYGYSTGANVTMAQVAGPANSGIRNLLQFTGASSVTAIGVGQRVESVNSFDLAGTTATLSAQLSNSLLTTVTWTVYYANTTDSFGTLVSPTRTQIATGTWTVNSTLTNYNASIAIPAAATTGIEVVFTVGAQTSGTWQIGNVQLEAGPVATGFEYRHYQQELALCQRYLPAFNSTGTSAFVGQGFATSGSNVNAEFKYAVTPRVVPTAVTTTSASQFTFISFTSGSASTASGISLQTSYTSLQAAALSVTTSGLTQGQGGWFYANNGSAQILFTGCEL
jgi:hypothetical protein